MQAVVPHSNSVPAKRPHPTAALADSYWRRDDQHFADDSTPVLAEHSRI
jgi:hypothetical protein